MKRSLKSATAFMAILLAFCVCPITVSGAGAISSSVYTVDHTRGYLCGVPAGTSSDGIKADLSNESASISFLDKNGAAYSGTAVTGLSVRLTEADAVVDSLIVVIPGDPSGDGAISISDYTLARLDILGLRALSNEYRAAADVDSNGSISISDYTLMRLHILGLRRITPAPSGLPLTGKVIGIDAGHQAHANYDHEPVSPGSTATKAKVSSGTSGRFTGVAEYVVNLQVALKLKAKLEALGAAVIMTRGTHDVDISNAERAQMMNDANVDCWIRIHANGNNNASVHGMEMLVPTSGCLNTSDSAVYDASVKLGQALQSAAASSAGAKDLGLSPRSDQTGFNWSSRPVCNIEMGYMTNEAEDRLLITDDYQEQIAQGLAQGFVNYFSS